MNDHLSQLSFSFFYFLQLINFKKIQLQSDIAIGHVCPKYNLPNLDKEMILQALEKTTPKANLIIVDWKGMGEHKERIVNILNEIGIEWKKTKDY